MCPRGLSERELFERYSEQRDRAAQRALVERYMPLARSLARQYRYAKEPLDDLTQTACVGLLKAIDRFDTTRGTAFTSFAVPTILGELRRHLRDRVAPVHVSRDAQERLVALRHERDGLATRLGRTPTVADFAAHLDCSVDKILEAQWAERARLPRSLDDPLLPGDTPLLIAECVGEEDPSYQLVEDRTTLSRMLRELPRRDRRILRLRFHDELTQREIAERLGCSQVHVSRTLRRIFDQLAECHERGSVAA